MEKVYKVSIATKFTALLSVIFVGAFFGFSVGIVLELEFFEYLGDDSGLFIMFLIPSGVVLFFSIKRFIQSFTGLRIELHGKELVIRKSRNQEEVFNVENISIGHITDANRNDINNINFFDGADLVIFEDGVEKKVKCRVLGAKAFKALIKDIALMKTPVKIN